MMQHLEKTENTVCQWLRGIDTALLRAVAAAAAVCMLLAHGFAFTNLFPNHDSTVLVYDAQWTMYVLGRWAQNFYFPLVRGKIAAPWLIGAFSTVYLALTGYIIARLLHLRRWSAVLLTGLLGTCASVTAQLATYTYETDAYMLAMLLACTAVWCTEKLPRVWGMICAAGCLCVSLALYQSYIQCGRPLSAGAFAARFAGYRVAHLAAAGTSGLGGARARRGGICRFTQDLAGAYRVSTGGYRKWTCTDAPAWPCCGADGHSGCVCGLLENIAWLFRLE